MAEGQREDVLARMQAELQAAYRRELTAASDPQAGLVDQLRALAARWATPSGSTLRDALRASCARELRAVLGDDDPGVLVDRGEMLTVAGAAAAVRVSEATVRKWISRGQLAATRGQDGRWWIGEQALYDCDKARRRAGHGRPRSL